MHFNGVQAWEFLFTYRGTQLNVRAFLMQKSAISCTGFHACFPPVNATEVGIILQECYKWFSIFQKVLEWLWFQSIWDLLSHAFLSVGNSISPSHPLFLSFSAFLWVPGCPNGWELAGKMAVETKRARQFNLRKSLQLAVLLLNFMSLCGSGNVHICVLLLKCGPRSEASAEFRAQWSWRSFSHYTCLRGADFANSLSTLLEMWF